MIEPQSELNIFQTRGHYFTNEAQSKTVNRKNIELNKFQFFMLSNIDYKLSWMNQLCLQLTIFLLFVLTAGTFGWIGFDITLRYSHRKVNNNMASLTLSNLLENLKQEQNYTFRNHDPSNPLFDSPSIKTYSINPPILNKLPKEYFEQDELLPNNFSYEDEYWSEKVDYSADDITQVSPQNDSSNEEVNLLNRSYFPDNY